MAGIAGATASGAAHGRSDEVVGDQVGRSPAGRSPGGVGLVRIDDRWDGGEGGRVEHRLGGAQQESEADKAGIVTRSRRTTRASCGQQARITSTRRITAGRSQRSTRAPLTSANSSQGTVSASVTADTAIGSWLTEAARSGKVTRKTPSPRFEIAPRFTAAGSRYRVGRGITIESFSID